MFLVYMLAEGQDFALFTVVSPDPKTLTSMHLGTNT